MFTIAEKTAAFAIFALSDRIDSATAPALDAELERLIRAGCSKIVLDLSAVSFLASAGLRLLLRAQNLCNSHKGGLVLAGVPDAVKTVLDIAGFTPHFKKYPDIASARASLGI